MTPFKTRFITIVVFFLLGIYASLGYFDWGKDGSFVRALCNLFRGFFGWGYFVAPPLLVIAAVLLIYRYDKPWAIWRSAALLGVIPLFGCVMQLIAGASAPEGSLWQTGMALTSGGLVSGALTSLLVRLFTPAGTWIILVPAVLLLIAAALNVNFRELFSSFKENAPAREQARRERQESLQRRRSEEYDEHLRERERLPHDRDHHTPPAQLSAPGRRGAYDQDRDGTFGEKTAVSAAPEPDPRAADPQPDTAEAEGRSNWDWFFRSAEARQKRIDTSGRATDGESNRNRRAREESGGIGTAAPSFTKEPPADGRRRKPIPSEPPSAPAEQPQARPPEKPERKKAAVEVPSSPAQAASPTAPSSYAFPPLDLLHPPVAASSPVRAEEASARLEQAFRSFGINLAVSDYILGPNVTRYEAEIEPGTKLSKLMNLEDDIALALGSSGVRIAAVPNKASTVGIEVPNRTVSTVYLREIIESDAFQKAGSKLTFALGKSIAGDAEVGNINKLPHLLIAGTTGSGKSVCLNSLILSLLYKATPEDVRFILVDPKMVEFKIYNGIPHLMSPVVTDPKKAAGALQWAVVEMMKRYRLFSDENTRDIDTYNTLMADRSRSGDGEAAPLPRIVVIIDELADLMMVAAKEVEDSICRVAQMGRAAGIHLVVATQSPRADVITGLIKANIPSRCALKVSSSLESRIILDSGGGAEKLIGNGDMLYAPIGTNKPKRIQGTWVSDEEREAVINFLKDHAGNAEYDSEMIAEMDRLAENRSGGKSEDSSAGSDGDPLSGYDEVLPEAVDVALDAGQVSVSMLQRRLKLGYSRAARVVDQMEELGVIGPYEGAKPRQVLISRAQWQEMQMIQGTAPVESLPPEPEDPFPDYESGEDFPPYEEEE
ncbi:MAG: DNA translocase FtsK [Oscillospiraceae bacterium]|nr:DNA translocase FtsK [Oscillospiraceae bacterium]